MSGTRRRSIVGLASGATRRAVLGGMTAAGLSGIAAQTIGARPAEPGADFLDARYQQEGAVMELTITHLSPEGMHKNPAYSQAIVVAGNAKTIYIGGQNAVNAEGQVVGAGDVAAQTTQIFANLETVLAAAGATLHDVIKWTVYIVQGHDFLPGYAIFQQKWGTSAKPPVVTAAIVAGLANPEFLVEIEAIAVVDATAS